MSNDLCGVLIVPRITEAVKGGAYGLPRGTDVSDLWSKHLTMTPCSKFFHLAEGVNDLSVMGSLDPERLTPSKSWLARALIPFFFFN